MNSEQNLVREFHASFDLLISKRPSLPDSSVIALRMNLIREESDELSEAFKVGNITDIAKELADLLYVVYGAAVSCGIDIEPIFKEVHRSNMTKIGGHKREDGKWVKPPTYSSAQLAPIIAAQSDD